MSGLVDLNAGSGNTGESGVSRGKDRRDFADFYRRV